jgi:hypothetical protein
MWTARLFTNNSWHPVQTTELQGAFSSNEVAPAARSLLGAKHTNLQRYLAVETDGHHRLAIELWGSGAAAASKEYEWLGGGRVEFLDGALMLFVGSADKPPTVRPATVAWHDRTTVIIPIDGDSTVEVRYEPDLSDEMTVGRMKYQFGKPEHELETIFDWRGYFGEDSAIIDGWRMMRRSGNGFVASIRGTTGFVVGNVLRRLSEKQPVFDTDPTMMPRLERMERSYERIAKMIPRLRLGKAITAPSATVFVHGTVSCGLASLKDLYAGPADQCLEPTFRYEHDTFKPLHENGADLATKIEESLRVKRLTLVGHSRGGLVARYARRQLRKLGYAAEVQMLTVGTPHRGTPIVQLAGRALNMFMKLGEEVLGALPVTSSLAKAYGILWDVPGLPQGIAAMDENSDAIAGLDVWDVPDRVHSWGSNFDIMSSPGGFGVDIDGILMGYLSNRAHDLVVPLESTLGFGTASAPLNCSHSRYFEEPAIKLALQALQRPLDVVDQVGPAPVMSDKPATLSPIIDSHVPELGRTEADAPIAPALAALIQRVTTSAATHASGPPPTTHSSKIDRKITKAGATTAKRGPRKPKQ